jgi:tetratricopeptide (TPR) repeat protein
MSSVEPTDGTGQSTTDGTRWERVQDLFHAAADLSPAEQRAFLESRCGDDPQLRSEVEALLAEDRRSSPLLDRDLSQIAHSVLGEGLPGDGIVGRYLLLRLIGEGGMGMVYLAERADLGGRVALKLLRDAWISPARRERFLSEQRTLAQLTHPSIAQLHEADTLPDGTPWFAMEYVEGAPLVDHCRQKASDIQERLRLFRAVCEAVQYAHRHAIIHRDLKPSNVLVTPDGAVKLLDFGIAKQLEPSEALADATRTGLRLMTPAYAAPEQFEGGRIGVHTDVYSLGVILYELLTDRLPFDVIESTPHEALRLIFEHEPVKPSAVARAAVQLHGPRARVPFASRSAWADLDVLCLTAMHRDPHRRYRTVEALIRDVDHYLRGEALEARPDSVRYRMGKLFRRHWRVVSAAALVLLGVVGLSTFYAWRLARARNAAVAEAQRTQRIQQFVFRLLEGGTGEAGPSEELRVVDLVDRGVREAGALESEPAVQAELYQTLGGIAQNLGKLDQAEKLLQTALDRRRALFGPDHAEVGRSLIALGMLESAAAHYDRAESLVREGLAMTRRRTSSDDPAVGRATALLGQLLENRGKYGEAIRVLEEAVRLLSGRSDSQPELAAALTELANSHFYSGHYQSSDELNRRVLAMDRRLFGERHPHVADDLINLGAVQLEWGKWPEAERFDREALEIMRAWYGPDHPETASAQTILARALVRQDKRGEAAVLLQQALATQERVYGPVHPRVASTLNELGLIAQKEGRLEEAKADFRRMADIYIEVHHGKHYQIGVALSNLAGVLQDLGLHGEAERMFRDVLKLYGQTLAPDHPLVGVARVRLGRVLLRQGRWEDARSESLAGYELLKKQAKPPPRWLHDAREDLAAELRALHLDLEAARFETELAVDSPGMVGARPR